MHFNSLLCSCGCSVVHRVMPSWDTEDLLELVVRVSSLQFSFGWHSSSADIDECSEGTHNCDPQAKCIDMEPIEDQNLK